MYRYHYYQPVCYYHPYYCRSTTTMKIDPFPRFGLSGNPSVRVHCTCVVLQIVGISKSWEFSRFYIQLYVERSRADLEQAHDFELHIKLCSAHDLEVPTIFNIGVCLSKSWAFSDVQDGGHFQIVGTLIFSTWYVTLYSR